MSYLDIGFSSLGIRTIVSPTRQTQQETRNLALPGSVVADALHESVYNLKIDKDGIYLGTAVPTYEEGRLKYNWSTHKLYVGGQTAWELVTSV